MTIRYDDIDIGQQLEPLVFGPVDRTTLALYCGGSGDHNPIHVDIDFAKKAGMDDVFAHGMLSMAVLARLLTNWIPQSQLREFGVRFTSITPVNATVTCLAKVIEKFEADGEKRLRLEVATQIDNETVTLAGSAVVALN